MRRWLIEFVPGLLGGVAGGYLGYLIVDFILRKQGMWVPIIPGALAGLGCGQVSTVASKRRGVVNGFVALAIVIYAQWKLFAPPFVFDGSLRDYVRHLFALPVLTLVVFALNALLAFWWGSEGRIRRARPKPATDRGPTEL